mmetsp:Transcript_142816/g.249084  ORF Transcript_142816/g.249084 Transcript_142816/m.249084 type:complete len:231 (-) Transcript_142816:516-1208(-)
MPGLGTEPLHPPFWTGRCRPATSGHRGAHPRPGRTPHTPPRVSWLMGTSSAVACFAIWKTPTMALICSFSEVEKAKWYSISDSFSSRKIFTSSEKAIRWTYGQSSARMSLMYSPFSFLMAKTCLRASPRLFPTMHSTIERTSLGLGWPVQLYTSSSLIHLKELLVACMMFRHLRMSPPLSLCTAFRPSSVYSISSCWTIYCKRCITWAFFSGPKRKRVQRDWTAELILLT